MKPHEEWNQGCLPSCGWLCTSSSSYSISDDIVAINQHMKIRLPMTSSCSCTFSFGDPSMPINPKLSATALTMNWRFIIIPTLAMYVCTKNTCIIKNESRDNILKLPPHVCTSLLSGYSLACKSPTLAQVLVPMSPADPRSSSLPYLLQPLNQSFGVPIRPTYRRL